MSELSELEIVELFERMDEDRICTPWGVECDNKATWIQRTICCGAEMPLCDMHKSWLVCEMLLIIAMDNGAVECRACGAWMIAKVMEDVMTLTRL